MLTQSSPSSGALPFAQIATCGAQRAAKSCWSAQLFWPDAVRPTAFTLDVFGDQGGRACGARRLAGRGLPLYVAGVGRDVDGHGWVVSLGRL